MLFVAFDRHYSETISSNLKRSKTSWSPINPNSPIDIQNNSTRRESGVRMEFGKSRVWEYNFNGSSGLWKKWNYADNFTIKSRGVSEHVTFQWRSMIDLISFRPKNVTEIVSYSCGFLFAGSGLSDTALGVFLLIFSIILLVACLIVLVKMLNTLLKERMALTITSMIDKEIPYVPWLSGYELFKLSRISSQFFQFIFEIGKIFFWF